MSSAVISCLSFLVILVFIRFEGLWADLGFGLDSFSAYFNKSLFKDWIYIRIKKCSSQMKFPTKPLLLMEEYDQNHAQQQCLNAVYERGRFSNKLPSKITCSCIGKQLVYQSLNNPSLLSWYFFGLAPVKDNIPMNSHLNTDLDS